MSVAVALITACGVVLVGVGGFFLVVRPPLLAEDVDLSRNSRHNPLPINSRSSPRNCAIRAGMSALRIFSGYGNIPNRIQR